MVTRPPVHDYSVSHTDCLLVQVEMRQIFSAFIVYTGTIWGQTPFKLKYSISRICHCKNRVSGLVLDDFGEMILNKKIECDFMKVFAPLLWNTLPSIGVSCVCSASLIDLEFGHCLFCKYEI